MQKKFMEENIPQHWHKQKWLNTKKLNLIMAKLNITT